MAACIDVSPPSKPSFLTGMDSVKPTLSEMLSPAVVFLRPDVPAPFAAIGKLFDYLRSSPEDAASLNASYPVRGVFKTAASENPSCDQKLTIDLSASRVSRIPVGLRSTLASHGLEEILAFFQATILQFVPNVISALSAVAGGGLGSLHKSQNFTFRLCDYSPSTAAPASSKGCGEHTDYGTFAIIFQDGHAGLEAEVPDAPGTWVPIPGDATVLLCGWCGLILSGGRICAVRHRVRRVPGVRRLSAVLFVAPDVDVVLKPVKVDEECRAFSDAVMAGEVTVEWFKEVMGRSWRFREGNGTLEDGEVEISQDQRIENLVWA